MTRIKGTPASPGIAIAPVHSLLGAGLPRSAPEVRDSVAPQGNPRAEYELWRGAVESAAVELRDLQESTRARLGSLKAEIFEAHLSIVRDPELDAAVKEGTQARGLSARVALREAADFFIQALESMEDELFKARIDDIRDVAARLDAHLEGRTTRILEGISTPVVVLADDLSPSETAQLDRCLVMAFVTAAGSRTSHSSILARSLGIPAVVGLGNKIEALAGAERIIVDGDEGLLILDPDTATHSLYLKKQAEFQARVAAERSWAARPSRTACGTPVELAANIGGPSDLESVQVAGAEGIGLFRTEFMYMDRSTLPTEEEQYRAYREVLEVMDGRPVVIRTLDAGGDKALDCLPMDREMNPFLGVRALRLCLERQDLFRTQLRALLRASVHGKLRIMFPMVATLEELMQAKDLLAREHQDLVHAGVPVAPDYQTGIMIEIPSAALMAHDLAREADFFSIGTNDLIQYTMAADRMNPKVGYLYQPLHPSILRLIGMVCEAAQAHGRWVGVCGEMGSEPRALPLLLGLGVREISMGAGSIPGSRARLARYHLDQLRHLARQALACSSAGAVAALCDEMERKTAS